MRFESLCFYQRVCVCVCVCVFVRVHACACVSVLKLLKGFSLCYYSGSSRSMRAPFANLYCSRLHVLTAMHTRVPAHLTKVFYPALPLPALAFYLVFKFLSLPLFRFFTEYLLQCFLVPALSWLYLFVGDNYLFSCVPIADGAM